MTIIKFIDKTLAAALVVAMTCILLTVIWQIVSRYLLQDPAAATEELSRFFLIWIGILGAAYAYKQRAHLGFNLIVERRSFAVKRILLTLVECVVIYFCVLVMVYGGPELVMLTLELNQISAALGVKMGHIYLVLPLSGLLIIGYSLVNIATLWSQPQTSTQ
tara:strand:- start:1033 stop:1518 length:486 start_codon:yes stop_codon:yes gene_type:complete